MTEPVDEHNLHERLIAFGDRELDDAQSATLWAFVAARPDGGAAAVRWLAEQQRLGVAGRRALAGGGPSAALRARIESMCCVEEMLAREQKAAGLAERATRSRWRLPGRALAAAAGVAIGLGAAAMIWRTPSAGAAAIVPAELVVDEGRVHASCSRLPTGLHDATFEATDATLASLARVDLGTDTPDLSAAGFAFVGAGPCPAQGFQSVHLLYRSTRPNSRAAVSLFVQANAGRFPAMTKGHVFRVSAPSAPFPTMAWRTDHVVYFLVADDDAIADAVLKALKR